MTQLATGQQWARQAWAQLAGAPSAVARQVRDAAQTTPGRLRLYLVLVVVLGSLAGVSAVVGLARRSGSVDDVATRSGPLAVQAQQLYRSLSDADATAAAAFLTSGVEPAQLRERYLDDIAAASAALAASASTGTEQAQVQQLAAGLPVYTGLVETARTLNRLNNPLGAAYLREASTFMREQLLPAAEELYRAATTRLANDRSSAAAFPWLTVALLLAVGWALVVTQLFLARRTQRLLNRGLAVASAATLVLALWVLGSWIAVTVDLHRSDRDGSAQVQAIAQARVLALQARADEALTLVARGSGGQFEQDFQERMAALADAGGALDVASARATDPAVTRALDVAKAAAQTWRAGHTEVRQADDGGDYPAAVTIAVTDPTRNSAAFTTVDASLQQAIAVAGAAFTENADDAGSGLTFAAVVWALLAVVAVAGAVLGIQQRLAEYR